MDVAWSPRPSVTRDGAVGADQDIQWKDRCSSGMLMESQNSWKSYRSTKERESPFLQPTRRPPRTRRKIKAKRPLKFDPTLILLLAFAFCLRCTRAAFIEFSNCLDSSTLDSNDPQLLQWVPLFVNARFNYTDPSHNLNVTIYGNVTGQATAGNYPSPNSKIWNNTNDDFGKIVDLDQTNNKWSTLFSTFKVLTYTPYDAQPARFCNTTINTTCPIAPLFFANASDPYNLAAFSVAHDFWSTYSFATFSSTIRVQTGAASGRYLACVSANITPDLGQKLRDALTYLPAAVLAFVAIATIFAAIFSPWGSSDIFRWTSNYGRDEDLLRLVTPGFGDCLQYIQFIVLSGSLSLLYPGYYQPVVRNAAWSTLMFNQSFVSHGNGTQSLVDGIYNVKLNGTYGISRMSQLVGGTQDDDLWAGMAIWLLCIVGIVIFLCVLAFLGRWAYRVASNSHEEDLQNKSWPFTVGNIIRIAYNYFLLPIVVLSLFQLVIAPHSPASVVAGSVVMLLLVMVSATWIFWLIFTTRPRAHLFDDLPTVLMYGPLYNTYSDDATPFAFIPVLLTFIRGVAIGAVQPSGIAQVVLLAIAEVIFILTLHAFRPFQAPTSMNAYHTFFSVVRLITILLSTAFVPSLGVTEAQKGWVGYVILLLHAVVLVFGFFLNAVQTMIEVGARLAGAGGEARGGLTKVFGLRQLARRNHHKNQRSSLGSTAAMLAPDGDAKSVQLMRGRSRSMSASSAVLLNQNIPLDRTSTGLDHSQGGDFSIEGTSPMPGTPGYAQSAFSYIPSGNASRRPTMGTAGTTGSKNAEPVDVYYRPPRPRRQTIDPYTPGERSRGSWASGDWSRNSRGSRPYEDSPNQDEAIDIGEGPSSFSPSRGNLAPAYLRALKDESDPNLERRKHTDYTTRESDFYYGVSRGPALSDQPTRRLKTGPADPMGPVSSATGWFKSWFGGKRKDKQKGFEVVRSTRAPPGLMGLDEEISPPVQHEPYRDNPEDVRRESLGEEDVTSARGHPDEAGGATLTSSDEEDYESDDDDPFESGRERVSEIPPMLGPIETGGGIELPSRIGSRSSSKPSRSGTERTTRSARRPPTIPRRSSRRSPSAGQTILVDAPPLPSVAASPPTSPGRRASARNYPNDHLQPYRSSARLPFGSTEPSPSPERSPARNSAASSVYPSGDASRQPSRDGNGLVAPPTLGGERPLSTGYVHHHLASDAIHPGVYDAHAHKGSQAELVNDPMRRSGSTGRTGRTGHSRRSMQ